MQCSRSCHLKWDSVECNELECVTKGMLSRRHSKSLKLKIWVHYLKVGTTSSKDTMQRCEDSFVAGNKCRGSL